MVAYASRPRQAVRLGTWFVAVIAIVSVGLGGTFAAVTRFLVAGNWIVTIGRVAEL
jgi:hypothetical protein